MKDGHIYASLKACFSCSSCRLSRCISANEISNFSDDFNNFALVSKCATCSS